MKGTYILLDGDKLDSFGFLMIIYTEIENLEDIKSIKRLKGCQNKTTFDSTVVYGIKLLDWVKRKVIYERFKLAFKYNLSKYIIFIMLNDIKPDIAKEEYNKLTKELLNSGEEKSI